MPSSHSHLSGSKSSSLRRPQPKQAISTVPPPRAILIVRLSAHGDVLQTLPLLSDLRQAWPETHIGWLTEPGAVPLLKGHPYIDQLHVVNRPQWLKRLKQPLEWFSIWQEASSLIKELRSCHYSVSFDVQGLLKSAIWPQLAGISTRMGFKATREGADRFYNSYLPRMNLRDGNTPAVERYRDFARAIGVDSPANPTFVLPPLSDADQQKAQDCLALLGPIAESRPRIALAPFTRWSSKHWTPEHWTSLIRGLLERDLQPVFMGAPTDREAADVILGGLSAEERSRVLDTLGQTDWPTLQALLSHCFTLIGSDSAPLHMADALGLPVIGLYGPTAPGRTGPIGKTSQTLTAGVVCQPCFQRNCPLPEKVCMTQLLPQQVLARLDKLLVKSKVSAPIQPETPEGE